MAIELRGFSDLQNDLLNMAQELDNGPSVNKALQAGAKPIEEQMLINTTVDPQIDTGALHNSIHTDKVKSSGGRKYITTGVHYKEHSAYYANPVEFGHGGPAPAPAHPFVRPAFDTRQNEAYENMKSVLRDAIKAKH